MARAVRLRCWSDCPDLHVRRQRCQGRLDSGDSRERNPSPFTLPRRLRLELRIPNLFTCILSTRSAIRGTRYQMQLLTCVRPADQDERAQGSHIPRGHPRTLGHHPARRLHLLRLRHRLPGQLHADHGAFPCSLGRSEARQTDSCSGRVALRPSPTSPA